MTDAATLAWPLDWLLDTDPALRWQVERDLLHAPPSVWARTRDRVATEGMGAALLAQQDDDGQWDGGAFFPKPFDWDGPEAQPGSGQPWTTTTWTLNSLREWGLDASVLAGTADKLTANSRWEYNEAPYWEGEVDCCINSWTLSNGLWLGADVDNLLDWFVEHRFADGGWNCWWEEGATVSSVHSTLNTLKGLLDAEAAGRATDASVAARRAGEEYLLSRGLHRRLSTGELIGDWVLTFGYPFRHFYDVLNAADYFRSAALLGATAPDVRMADAVELVRAARQPDGRWLQGRRHPGRVWFELDVPVGEPSPWLTFFAVRVLDWWDGRSASR